MSRLKPGPTWMREQNTTAHATTNTTANATANTKAKGSLHCADHDETVICFGRDDASWVGRNSLGRRLRDGAESRF